MSYQLLIVDDEVLIRKALSQYIDWESLNCVALEFYYAYLLQAFQEL